jgi:hypothetical protein
MRHRCADVRPLHRPEGRLSIFVHRSHRELHTSPMRTRGFLAYFERLRLSLSRLTSNLVPNFVHARSSFGQNATNIVHFTIRITLVLPEKTNQRPDRIPNFVHLNRVTTKRDNIQSAARLTARKAPKSSGVSPVKRCIFSRPPTSK